MYVYIHTYIYLYNYILIYKHQYLLLVYYENFFNPFTAVTKCSDLR